MKRAKLYIVGIMTAIMTIMPLTEVHAVEKGEKVVGVQFGYASRNSSADLGLFFQYTFSKHFRLQPQAQLVFRNKNRDAFLFDINAQVPIAFTSNKFTLYPFAGLNFSSWNQHNIIGEVNIEENPENPEQPKLEVISYSERKNSIGVNLGAGFDLKVSSSLKISLEAGYTFVKYNSGVRVLAGIGYIF